MNKLNKIFLTLIIILIIILGILTYYYFYWREGCLKAANELVRITDAVQAEGYSIQTVDNETVKLVKTEV